MEPGRTSVFISPACKTQLYPPKTSSIIFLFNSLAVIDKDLFMNMLRMNCFLDIMSFHICHNWNIHDAVFNRPPIVKEISRKHVLVFIKSREK